MMGGSADLDPSTHTNIDGAGNFEPENWAGHNMHFGIRENAMGAILNGMALHAGSSPMGEPSWSSAITCALHAPGSNELSASDLCLHPRQHRMGEDGPTHQPVEQLLGLRSIPGMVVIRPADANETVAAWRIAIAGERSSRIGVHAPGASGARFDRYPGIAAGVPLGGYILRTSPRVQNPTSFSSRPAPKCTWH